jgi:hypothetical protein
LVTWLSLLQQLKVGSSLQRVLRCGSQKQRCVPSHDRQAYSRVYVSVKLLSSCRVPGYLSGHRCILAVNRDSIHVIAGSASKPPRLRSASLLAVPYSYVFLFTMVRCASIVLCMVKTGETSQYLAMSVVRVICVWAVRLRRRLFCPWNTEDWRESQRMRPANVGEKRRFLHSGKNL